jgi:hypothetical protein
MRDEPNNIINALARKLLIKPASRWLFLNAPDNYMAALEPLPADVQVSSKLEGEFVGIQLFVADSLELSQNLTLIEHLLRPDTILWVAYPKKNSGIKTDLEMTGSWDAASQYGLNTVAAASINETWTGIRLRPVDKIKTSGTSNESIKQNDYADFIDTENKVVTLPPDLKLALEQEHTALTYYNALSYSNKKEYVLWVLTAKQQKTRSDRIAKAVEKLAAGKKNPTEK